MKATSPFIDEHVKEFGLRGTNNLVPDDRNFKPLPPCTQLFTKENHFRFGFNDVEFSSRSSLSAIYWVEYGKPRRRHRGFLTELKQAIADIYDIYGSLSISNSGNRLCRGLITAAKEMGIPLEQITIDIAGHPAPPHDESFPHRVCRITWDDFSEFAYSFSQDAGCAAPWEVLEAYHGHVSETPHIYTDGPLFFFNRSYDYPAGKWVGPADWALNDREIYTATNRWLLISGRKGIPQILRWSPELIAAQLDTEHFRTWLREAAPTTPPSVPSEIWWDELHTRIPPPGRGAFEEGYITAPAASNIKAARNDDLLNSRMAELERKLRSISPGCDAVHYYPLHRLAECFDLDFDCGGKQQTYGCVRKSISPQINRVLVSD